MSLLEVESWRVAEGQQERCDHVMRDWFAWVQAHRAELFPEWKSARYYRVLDQGECRGEPTGRYVMLFEFYSLAARDAYKERRKDWSGPYAEYRKVDPYQFFDGSSVTLELWEPHEQHLWLDFDSPPRGPSGSPLSPPTG